MATFETVMPIGDSRRFAGEIHFFDRAGWFVVSDIDDTIKITEVTDSGAALRNTFLEPFRSVPGMASLFQQWAGSNSGFFYVSASPWQLYLPLSDFMRSNRFPAGVFEMKPFRLKDSTRLNLFEDPETYKLREIEPILERFPAARFVLVGDSGERDPEIYAALAREHPKQIARILIRNVTRQDADAPRYQETFRGVPRQTWEVFTDPAAIDPVPGPN
jgi:phosphatidate phosphatase APP1